MNKAYQAFRQIYPDAYYIYLVRNPYFQIASHLRFKSYEEIKRWVDPQRLKQAFCSPHLVDKFYLKTPEQTFALLWYLENEWVYNEIKRAPPRNLLIIRYEDIVADYSKLTKKVFNFLGLEYCQQTRKFIQQLQTPFKQKHARSSFTDCNLNYKIHTPRLTDNQQKNITSVIAEGGFIKELGYEFI